MEKRGERLARRPWKSMLLKLYVCTHNMYVCVLYTTWYKSNQDILVAFTEVAVLSPFICFSVKSWFLQMEKTWQLCNEKVYWSFCTNILTARGRCFSCLRGVWPKRIMHTAANNGFGDQTWHAHLLLNLVKCLSSYDCFRLFLSCLLFVPLGGCCWTLPILGKSWSGLFTNYRKQSSQERRWVISVVPGLCTEAVQHTGVWIMRICFLFCITCHCYTGGKGLDFVSSCSVSGCFYLQIARISYSVEDKVKEIYWG